MIFPLKLKLNRRKNKKIRITPNKRIYYYEHSNELSPNTDSLVKSAIPKDLVMLSGIAGLIASIVKLIYSGTFYLLNITEDFGVLIAGRMIFHTQGFPLNWEHLTIATITHLIFGSIIAVGLGLTYYFSGKDFYLLKGAVFGLMVWFLLRNLLVEITVPGGANETNAITTAVSFSSHILFGLITGYIITKFERFAPTS